MSKQKPQFFVFYGGEDYLLDRELRKALSWQDKLVLTLDGEDTSEDKVISSLEQISLETSGVVVVLDNAEKVSLGPSFKDHLEGRRPSDTSVLVAIVRKDKLPKCWEEIAQKGRSVSHPKYKVWQTRENKARLAKEAGLFGLVVKDDAASLFFKLHKDDFRSIANDLQKLSFILKKGSNVERKHVLLVCPRQIPVLPWDVADAAFSRATLKRALQYTSLLFDNEGDGVAIPIVASLMRQTERLLIARSMVDQNKSQEAIGTALDLKPFVVQSMLPLVRRHKASVLRDQMKKLCELELKVKGTAQSKRTLVELAVLSLAA